MRLKLGRKQCLNVGSHMWWGDLYSKKPCAAHRQKHAASGNQSIAAGNLRGICCKVLRLRQILNKRPAQCQFDHNFVDDADDLHDIYLYSLMDMYIQCRRLFCVMASLIEPGKTMITYLSFIRSIRGRFDDRKGAHGFHSEAVANLYVTRVKQMQSSNLFARPFLKYLACAAVEHSSCPIMSCARICMRKAKGAQLTSRQKHHADCCANIFL